MPSMSNSAFATSCVPIKQAAVEPSGAAATAAAQHEKKPAAAAAANQQDVAPQNDTACVREVEINDDQTLQIAEQHGLENDAGGVVWDAALVLSHYLVKQQQEGGVNLKGKRVIELGAGTGIVGLTAAALGAAEVVLTDRQHLLGHLNSNIKRNNLHEIARATAISWDKAHPPDVQPPYDIILCSDLVYNKKSVRLLLSTLQQLAGPASVIYASCEFREDAGLELLHQLMSAYELQEQLVPYTDLHEDWCSPDILVWRVKKVQQSTGS